jgi:hypothetical protein
VNTAANSSNYLSENSIMFNKVEAEFNKLYSASFLPSYANYSSDPYNNALIPLLDDEATNSSEWQITNLKQSTLLYASAYGIPIALVPNTSNTSIYYDDFTDDSKY